MLIIISARCVTVEKKTSVMCVRDTVYSGNLGLLKDTALTAGQLADVLRHLGARRFVVLNTRLSRVDEIGVEHPLLKGRVKGLLLDEFVEKLHDSLSCPVVSGLNLGAALKLRHSAPVAEEATAAAAAAKAVSVVAPLLDETSPEAEDSEHEANGMMYTTDFMLDFLNGISGAAVPRATMGVIGEAAAAAVARAGAAAVEAKGAVASAAAGSGARGGAHAASVGPPGGVYASVPGGGGAAMRGVLSEPALDADGEPLDADAVVAGVLSAAGIVSWLHRAAVQRLTT